MTAWAVADRAVAGAGGHVGRIGLLRCAVQLRLVGGQALQSALRESAVLCCTPCSGTTPEHASDAPIVTCCLLAKE
jgi:hypothetical protein